MKYIITLLFTVFTIHVNAQVQDEVEVKQQPQPTTKSGFQRDRLFTGGNATVGFSNKYTVVGLSPVIGYSFTDWFDAGLSLNFNYTSYSDYYNPGDKLRETVYGPGAFMRFFPVDFLFAGAMYEFNAIRQKYIDPNPSKPDEIDWYSSNSFLVGGGFTGGRRPGANSYFYLSVMWDIGGDPKSPYTDQFGNSKPIFRAGYNIGLFQARYGR